MPPTFLHNAVLNIHTRCFLILVLPAVLCVVFDFSPLCIFTWCHPIQCHLLTEISNLRSAQDNSRHRRPPIKVQLLQSSLVLWHQKANLIQPYSRQEDKLIGSKLQRNYRAHTLSSQKHWLSFRSGGCRIDRVHNFPNTFFLEPTKVVVDCHSTQYQLTKMRLRAICRKSNG